MTQLGTLRGNAEPLTIGAWNNHGMVSRQFDGKIDGVRVWNTARAQAEIAANMGFGPEEEHRPGHFGLQGMRERLAELGGELRVQSSPRGGEPGGIPAASRSSRRRAVTSGEPAEICKP